MSTILFETNRHFWLEIYRGWVKGGLHASFCCLSRGSIKKSSAIETQLGPKMKKQEFTLQYVAN
jgi:hypothetical protein